MAVTCIASLATLICSLVVGGQFVGGVDRRVLIATTDEQKQYLDCYFPKGKTFSQLLDQYHLCNAKKWGLRSFVSDDVACLNDTLKKKGFSLQLDAQPGSLVIASVFEFFSSWVQRGERGIINYKGEAYHAVVMPCRAEDTTGESAVVAARVYSIKQRAHPLVEVCTKDGFSVFMTKSSRHNPVRDYREHVLNLARCTREIETDVSHVSFPVMSMHRCFSHASLKGMRIGEYTLAQLQEEVSFSLSRSGVQAKAVTAGELVKSVAMNADISLLETIDGPFYFWVVSADGAMILCGHSDERFWNVVS